MEADFQREYHIDLTAVLFTLSYRRFLSLVGGLSAESVFWAVINKHKKGPKAKRLNSREEVAAFFRSRG